MNALDDDLAEQLLAVQEINTALVLDGDRTLGPYDTGRLVGGRVGVNDDIRSVFQSQGYCTPAFRDVAAIWGAVPTVEYQRAVAAVGSEVQLHLEWLRLLPGLRGKVQVVVVTSGIPQIWRRVLMRHGLDHIPVVGGCRRGADDYVVCPGGKAAVVRVLQRRGMKVGAAGDSEIDLPMLLAADAGFVVPDHRGSPRLFSALETQAHRLRHLAFDDRDFGVVRVGVDELKTELLEELC